MLYFLIRHRVTRLLRRRKVGELDSLFALGRALRLAPLLALVSELEVVDSGKGGDCKCVIDREGGFDVGEVFAVSLLENVVVGGLIGLRKE